MSRLPNEAYAILRGRHSDPFRYLGRHQEQGHNVVCLSSGCIRMCMSSSG